MFVLEEEQRKETDIFVKLFFFLSPHLEQMKIVQNDERPSKVILRCSCAVLLHPVYTLFLLFLLWSLETSINVAVSWNACYCIWRWENSVSPQQSVDNNKQVQHAQAVLVRGRGRSQINLMCQYHSDGSGWKYFCDFLQVIEYKHYLKGNYSYCKSIRSMQDLIVPKGKLLRLWYRCQHCFKRLVFKSLLITVKYVACSKSAYN